LQRARVEEERVLTLGEVRDRSEASDLVSRLRPLADEESAGLTRVRGGHQATALSLRGLRQKEVGETVSL
jgi:hypothetical protein